MLAVAYFAALLARSADRWQARDADLDEIDDIAGLVNLMRESSEELEEEPDVSVLLLEQEDVWFAVVRLDAEEDPRLFVSDAAAVSRSAYADLLLSADLVEIGPDGRPSGEPVPEPEPEPADPEAEQDPQFAELDLAELAEPAAVTRRGMPNGPVGDAELLADFGVSAADLAALCRDGLLPADALADLAEALGAADELEEVR